MKNSPKAEGGKEGKTNLKNTIMYRVPKFNNRGIEINTSSEGETIEQKIERITLSGDAISDPSKPTLYSEDGEVKPEWNVRTDKQENFLDTEIANNEKMYNRRKEALEAKNKEENGEMHDPNKSADTQEVNN